MASLWICNGCRKCCLVFLRVKAILTVNSICSLAAGASFKFSITLKDPDDYLICHMACEQIGKLA